MDVNERLRFVDKVIDEVADREGVKPTELPPLYVSLDPDALASLIESASTTTVSVEFEYCGHNVTVDSDGHVKVETAQAIDDELDSVSA